jgi:hypothetical protein
LVVRSIKISDPSHAVEWTSFAIMFVETRSAKSRYKKAFWGLYPTTTLTSPIFSVPHNPPIPHLNMLFPVAAVFFAVLAFLSQVQAAPSLDSRASKSAKGQLPSTLV